MINKGFELKPGVQFGKNEIVTFPWLKRYDDSIHPAICT